MIGEYCFNNLKERKMRLFPRFVARRDGWSGDEARVLAPLLREGQDFTVIGIEGQAIGTYLSSPDVTDGFVGTMAYRGGLGTCSSAPQTGDAACLRAGACGIAVAEVPGDDFVLAAPEDTATTSCVADGQLIADLDGDGKDEAFDLADFIDGDIGAPGFELGDDGAALAPDVRGELYTGKGCTQRFATYQLKVDDSAQVDVLGVLDLDSDGKRELVIALRAGSFRMVAVYRAREEGTRLDRLATTIDSDWFK